MTEEFPNHLTSDSQVTKIIEARFDKTDHDLVIKELVEVLATEIKLITKDNQTTVVSLIGGAASGKSTLAESLTTELSSRDISTDTIGTDDFVIGDRAYRREHMEGKEPKAKYDFILLNAKIAKIKANRDKDLKVSVPTYDPKNGAAIAKGEENYTHKVGKVDVLLVEGDFDEVGDTDLKIYVHVPDRQRLDNRVRRDISERDEADEQKIRDNFLQRQETQHIPYTVPVAQYADILVDARLIDDGWSYDIYHAQSDT